MFPSSLGANLGWQLGSVLYRQSGRPEPELSWSVGNIPATHQHVTGHHPPHYIYISTPFCLIYLHACFLLREVDTLTAFYPSFRTSGPVCLTLCLSSEKVFWQSRFPLQQWWRLSVFGGAALQCRISRAHFKYWWLQISQTQNLYSTFSINIRLWS